jgi:protein TonB
MHHNTSTAKRKTLVVLGVLLIHGLGLWLLQSGLLQNVADVVVPVQVISTSMDVNPAPAQALAPPVKTKPSLPPAVAAKQARLPATPPALPNQAADSPNASTVPLAPPAPATPAQSTTASLAATASPAPAKVQLPTHDAAYLQNPKPDYPALSVRRGEQGQVVLNVLIGVDGKAQKAEIAQSSGFERLDAAALATVLRWRYVPGKRGGVPEEMWFKVPLAFVLD